MGVNHQKNSGMGVNYQKNSDMEIYHHKNTCSDTEIKRILVVCETIVGAPVDKDLE
jgi:hypothetical protein